ncbi:MAG: redoxin domain-containing protein [Geodermatophilaceae bacterium]|nr:redoxin domain-containing protein [Geodermatophilaceae bacterium]
MRRYRQAMVLALALMTLITACGTASGDPGSTSGGLSAEPLQFTAQTIDDQSFEGSSLAGKASVLWFWAPWCTECRREAPSVAAVQAAVGDEVTFVGVAGLGEIPEMQAFVDDYGVSAFTHLADVDGSIWSRFGITRQPAYAFIDASGHVEVVRGVLGESGLADKVAELTAP